MQGPVEMHDGRRATRVRAFAPWSQAPQAGVQVGDLMQTEHWIARRALRPGEVIAMDIVRNGAVVPTRLTAAERPIDPIDRWHFALRATRCGLGTLLGLVIGLRQTQDPTSRALALAFLWRSLNLGSNPTSHHGLSAMLEAVCWLALAPGWHFGLWFAIHHPGGQPQGRRRALCRLLPLFLAALVPVEVVALGLALDRVSPAWFNWTQVPYIGAAGVLSAVLPALVVLAHPKVKPRAEWLVDRVFFGQWVAREAGLARFVADARGSTEAPALALAAAGDRFSCGAGVALYVRQPGARYQLQQGASIDAPQVLDADEPLAVALRAGGSMASREDVDSALPGELAMVLSRQRELDACVLIGRRRDGSAMRSDEVVALRQALQTAGLDWQALRWDALQREVTQMNADAV
jgi:hypothetical protein